MCLCDIKSLLLDSIDIAKVRESVSVIIGLFWQPTSLPNNTRQSLRASAEEVQATLTAYVLACPDSKIAIFGYSRVFMVVRCSVKPYTNSLRVLKS